MQNKDIRVIIPLHTLDDEIRSLLAKAVESVPSDIKVTIACPENVQGSLSEFEKRVDIVTVAPESDFCSIVNKAVESIDEKWFSILEFDDTYTPIWFDNAKYYAEFMPEVSVFMPLEDITDFNTGKYINLGNVESWASSFSNEIGYIDLDCLQNYFDFYLTGSLFNTADWREVGGLKPHIKITFWYEWLLRTTNKGKKVFVIPKVGYNHTLGRKGSLVELYKEQIGNEETEWWFDLAKKDYFFKEEKDPSYYQYNKS